MKSFFAHVAIAGLLLMPFQAFAAFYRPFEYSGWIPYWRSATGTAEFLAHMDVFTEINPFAYTVKSDGSLADQMDLQSEPWPSLIKLAHLKNIRVIPTVMWHDGDHIHRVLKNPELRANHIKSIVEAVNAGGFDGIDIDYEDKLFETKQYYSLFLKELYKAMGKKWVMCTIEARTPLDSLRPGKVVKPEYVNDYAVLNRYCDRVRIMAYDQGSIDQKLTTSITTPYIPVADVRWVEKVLALAVKDISRKKLMLGVATYGYEYKVRTLSSGYAYDQEWAFNPRYATELAASLGITPQRNVAGEISFSYRATTSDAGAILDSSTNILWWSDASAIKDKIDLAKRYGIRGISVFKIDGGSDPNIWNVLK